MKFILKILFAPVILLLWVFCGLCNLCIKVSASVLVVVAILFAVAGVVTIIDGRTLTGCIGLVIAFLLSPYGLPMLATLILARFYMLRYWLKEKIYE